MLGFTSSIRQASEVHPQGKYNDMAELLKNNCIAKDGENTIDGRRL